METWLDHAVYTICRNDENNTFEAKLLHLDKCTPEVVNWGWDTMAELKTDIPPSKFQQEIDRRTTHTAETLYMLKNTYAGDLREQWVYGSILRPMSGIRIDNATYLNGNNDQYGMWKIHEYVVHPGPLDARLIEHYDLVFISHP